MSHHCLKFICNPEQLLSIYNPRQQCHCSQITTKLLLHTQCRAIQDYLHPPFIPTTLLLPVQFNFFIYNKYHHTYNFVFFLCVRSRGSLSLGWDWGFRLRPASWAHIVRTSRQSRGWGFKIEIKDKQFMIKETTKSNQTRKCLIFETIPDSLWLRIASCNREDGK